MLTLKNVLPDGHEDVITVERVGFSPDQTVESENDPGVAKKIPSVVYGDTGKDVIPFTEGTVYVMNDSGKTVATYTLAYPGPNTGIHHKKTIGDYAVNRD